MSWLSTLGNDVKKVFGWLGSPKGQAVLSAGEGIVEVVDPALDGIINLTNTWLQEIFKAQALAAAASANATGGVQKSAMVLNTVTPQIIAFATAQGLPIPTGVELQNANNALVAFLNALGGGSTATAAPVSLANTLTGTAQAQAPLSVKAQISTNSLL
jgi:hypothetical protein